MRLHACGFLMFLSSVAAVAAERPSAPAPEVQWVARVMMMGSPKGLELTRDQAERNMAGLFKTISGRLPQFGDLARRLDIANREPRQRAQAIARFLEKDLDNDGVVTMAELTAVFKPQSMTMLRSSNGIEIEPTPEQAQQILQKMLDQTLQADTNRDGIIDFEEMRSAAAQARPSPLRMSEIRLSDPMIVKAFDTSGDKIISKEEFLAAVRKTFSDLDSNKDGRISAEEARPFVVRGTNTTF